METAILAGGRSSRFGANKALADWFGAPLIATIAEKAGAVTEKVFIISNDEAPYRFLDIPVYPDIYPGMGPLSGLHSALSHAASNRVMVLACDMPLLNTDLLRHLISIRSWAPVITVEAKGRIEPLHSVYHRSLLHPAGLLLASGVGVGLTRFIESLPHRTLSEEAVRRFCPSLVCLASANTPEALARLKGVALRG